MAGVVGISSLSLWFVEREPDEQTVLQDREKDMRLSVLQSFQELELRLEMVTLCRSSFEAASAPCWVWWACSFEL